MRILLLTSPLILFGLASSLAQNSSSKGSVEEIQRVVERASFEFSNPKMYANQSDWVGKTIAFQASFSARTDILNTDLPYEQVSGQSPDGDPINALAFYDTPLITSRNTWETGTTISRADRVYIFGVVQKCKEVITRTGVVRVLPMLDLLLVFRLDDRAFRDPIWVSKSLRH